MISLSNFPVCEEFHKFEDSWNQKTNFVLQAPTGSGKSLGLPWIIYKKAISKGQILVVQPRRIAAVSLARTLSGAMKSDLGQEIGYQVRFDKRCSKESKIIYLTDGILLKLITSDSTLSRASLVIFDEFHERSLYLDASLALVKKIQKEKRPDLKIMLVSATLDLKQACNYLPNTCSLKVRGRSYPVEIVHKNPEGNFPFLDEIPREAKRLMNSFPGDLLIFMDGVASISKLVREIQKQKWSAGILVLRFFGDMPLSEQEQLFETKSQRKIIIATNIAETSLTIPGIQMVIDSGYAKVSSFDPVREINTLLSEKICRSSANQRSGRAGRTSKGYCLRLWSESDHLMRKEFDEAEIHRLDLSELCLEIISQGYEPEKLDWFEAPSLESWQKARNQLKGMGLLNEKGSINSDGKLISKIPLPPKLGLALLHSDKENCLSEMALIFSMVDGKNPVSNSFEAQKTDRNPERVSDLDPLLDAYFAARKNNFSTDYCRNAGIHGMRMRECENAAMQLCSYFGRPFNPNSLNHEVISKILIQLYPDRIIRLKSPARKMYEDSKGNHLHLSHRSTIGKSDWALALSVTERKRKNQIQVQMDFVTEIEEKWIVDQLCQKLIHQKKSYLDLATRMVVSESYLALGVFKLNLRLDHNPGKDQIARAYAQEIIAGNLNLKNWNIEVDQFLERLKFLWSAFPEYEIKPLDSEDLFLLLEQLCLEKKNWKEIKNANVFPHIINYLNEQEKELIRELVPTEISLGKNKNLKKLHYSVSEVTLNAKIQDLYDLSHHPKIVNGKYPIIVNVLAPNQHVVQRTSDITSFWDESYPSIKRELAGRYPKHEWR